jgi:four helix bundle protein
MNEINEGYQNSTEKRKYDLEDRLIDFAVMVSEIIEMLPNTKLANNLGNQGTRSSTAPALIYGEVQSAESQRDFKKFTAKSRIKLLNEIRRN